MADAELALERKCSDCGKQWTVKRPAARNPFHGRCRPCSKQHWRKTSGVKRTHEASPESYWKSWLKYRYGLTPEQYNTKLVEQKGVCAICKKPPTGGRRLHIDHNHQTGEVRGLLCNGCNRGIGYLQESQEVLLEAVRYLQVRGSGRG